MYVNYKKLYVINYIIMFGEIITFNQTILWTQICPCF